MFVTWKIIYTTNEIIKDLMINYIKNLSNWLGKVDTHFLTDITNGIISNNSVVLANFSRFASPNIRIKKGAERLEHHLDKYSNISNIVENNYTQMIKPISFTLLTKHKLHLTTTNDEKESILKKNSVNKKCSYYLK